MVFQDTLDLVKTTVDEGLAGFFIRKKQEAKKISPHCTMLAGEVADITMRGGKRTRAFLCGLGAQAAKETKISKELQYAMMGLELFQSFALIHDDIIDEDLVRRGGPTVHVKLGVSMAILAGAEEKTLISFVPYGLAVGKSYQLRDDMIDDALGQQEFQKKADNLEKQAFQVIKNLKCPKSVTILLADFARFALRRSV